MNNLKCSFVFSPPVPSFSSTVKGVLDSIYFWHFQEAKMTEPVLQRQLTERAVYMVCIAGVDDPLWSDG